MITTQLKKNVFASLILGILLFPVLGFAGNTATSTTGVNGYDLVSYHTGEKPLVGNGNHVAIYNGVSYLFVNEENKTEFESNPRKYLPAYGGYCAFGVAVGKKFVSDPDVWKIVDDRLYLNLDAKIQGMWSADIPGKIKEADKNWNRIKDKDPSDL